VQPPDIRHALTMPDGTVVTIRPICSSDKDIELAFVRGLSPDSKYFRFLAPIKDLTPQMLERFVNVDYPAEMALIATIPANGGEREIGVARYASDAVAGATEFAVVVADAWQGKGIGRVLMRRLFDIARDAGVERMEGFVLKVNRKMLGLMRELGFAIDPVPGEAQLVRVGKDL
jgi:acetyltransferase